MQDITPTERALADLQTGTVRTMAAICRQLIEARALDHALLESTMKEVIEALTKEGVGIIGVSVPAALIDALRQNAERQP